MLQKAFFSDEPVPELAKPAHGHAEPMEPISVPERLGAVILIAATLVIGLYPRLLLDLIVPAFNLP